MKKLIASLFTSVLVLGITAVTLAGCGAAPCTVERGTVAGLGLTLRLAQSSLPDTPEVAQAVGAAEASIAAGEHLVESCEIVRDSPEAFDRWLETAQGLVEAVLDIVEAAGVTLPVSRATASPADCVCPVESGGE